MANFKAQNPQGGYKPRIHGREIRRNAKPTSLFAFVDSVNTLYLWTKSGVLKHSHFILLSQSYFVNAAQATTSENEPAPNKFETAKLLVKMAELTTDENLRDEFLKSAFELPTA